VGLGGVLHSGLNHTSPVRAAVPGAPATCVMVCARRFVHEIRWQTAWSASRITHHQLTSESGASFVSICRCPPNSRLAAITRSNTASGQPLPVAYPVQPVSVHRKKRTRVSSTRSVPCPTGSTVCRALPHTWHGRVRAAVIASAIARAPLQRHALVAMGQGAPTRRVCRTARARSRADSRTRMTWPPAASGVRSPCNRRLREALLAGVPAQIDQCHARRLRGRAPDAAAEVFRNRALRRVSHGFQARAVAEPKMMGTSLAGPAHAGPGRIIANPSCCV